ncbi:MAG: sensor histidine kinase [Gaiellaceae bacterium]
MRLRSRVDRWGDWIVAVALAASFERELWMNPPPGGVTGGRASLALPILLMTIPLAQRRRAPVPVLFAIVCALAVGSFLISPTASWPVEPYVALLLAFYSVGAHCSDRPSLLAGLAALTTIVCIDFVRSPFQTIGVRPGAWLTFVVAWLVGRDLRRRRRELKLLRERAAGLEREREERARTAVTEERGRIARELHDVIAHGVSVMVVQAQAGPRLLGDPDQARAVFRSIEASGREALHELRRLLGILRTGDEQMAIGPQPGLGSLDSLVDQVREAGLPVELRIEGEEVPLPAGIDLSAYRIVQEALTNTIKHAGQAKAEVVVRYGTSDLELEVVDNGSGAPASVNGSGHGLIGMRERVALYGGVLETGTRNDGGYAVRARLPLARGAG